MRGTFFLTPEDLFDARPAQGTIQSGYLRGFKNLVRMLGGNHRKVLEAHQLDPTTFEDPDYHIDCKIVASILEYCSVELDDPLFGLHLAEQQDPDVLGCVTAIARAAPDLGQALQCLINYAPVTNSPDGCFEMVFSQENVELRWSSEPDLGEQIYYQGLLVFIKTLRMLGDRDFRPDHVALGFAIPGLYRSKLEDQIGCRVFSSSMSNSICFDRRQLQIPVRSSNRILFRILESYMERLRTSPPVSASEQARSFIRGALPSGRYTIDRCAERLGTTERTLQRRLASESTSFSTLVEEQRNKLAKLALADNSHSLDDIAFNLGYSEQSSFGRAFKRWTGVSPRSFRKGSKVKPDRTQ